MNNIRVFGLVVLFCTMLMSVAAGEAQKLPVPSGTVTAGVGSATATEYLLQTAPGKSQGVLKLDPLGVVGPDVTFETQIKIAPGPVGDSGILYRTSYWGTTNDTYGWYVGIMKGGVLIGYGSNSSVSAWHRIQSVAMPLSADVWYKLKVIAIGENHKVFLNDKLVLEINNPRYSDISGYAGLRVFKIATSYKNITIE